MAIRTIRVGKEHEAAYRSVCFLIENGGLDGLGYRVVNGRICSDTMEYVLSEERGHGGGDGSEAFGFGENGATWFAALRGERGEDDNAVWMDFMNAVKKQYHKNYSVVEFEQQRKTKQELQHDAEIAEEIIETFIATFVPDLAAESARTLHPVDDEVITEDVYGAAMRIEVSADVTRGAPLPVLCKVYFNRSGDRVQALPRSSALVIDETVAKIVPNEGDAEKIQDAGDTIDVTLKALDELLNTKSSRFGRCVLYSEQDERSLESMRSMMSHGHFELECKHVDLLYITHVKTENYVCDLYVGGAAVLRISLGIDDRFSIRCLNCNDSRLLVSRNEIVYEVDGQEKSFLLDYEAENMGLSDEDVAEIREHSHIAEHFKPVRCEGNPRVPGGCHRTRCAGQLIPGTCFCNDCPYPEVLYADFAGQRYPADALVVAADLAEAYPDGSREQQELCVCNLCQRVVKNTDASGYCELCAQALSPSKKDPEAKKLYRIWRGVLPLSVRLFSVGKRKACYEDDEMLVLVVGNKRFGFNKLNVSERGLLDKAFHLK